MPAALLAAHYDDATSMSALALAPPLYYFASISSSLRFHAASAAALIADIIFATYICGIDYYIRLDGRFRHIKI